MSYQIRKAELEDVNLLASIYISAFAGEPWYETWSYDKAKNRIYEVISSGNSLCFVCEDSKDIVGCSLCMLMSWHTGMQLEGKEVFVNPKHQNKGIAEILIRHTESVAKTMDVTEFFFWTKRDGRSSNPDRLCNYYKRLGFTIAKERIIMVKAW